ncbi:MAG: hypothetical protein JXA25_10305 [Anaerolineales bacterium]|nr:hypothetical protein [Anaerolineales bacterium]
MPKAAGFLSNLVTFLAIIAAVLVVLLFPLTFLFAGVADVTADQELVINLTARHFVESDLLYGWLVNSILDSESSPGEGGDGGSMQAVLLDLALEDQILISKLLLPKEWAAAEIKTNTNELYTWLNGQVDYPKLVLHTGSLSESMTMVRADMVARVLIGSWPGCSPEVVSGYQTGELSKEEFLSSACKPAEERAQEYMINQLKESLMDMYKDLPDETALLQRPDQRRLVELDQTRENILRVFKIMMWSWLIPVFLLGVVMVLRVRSWRNLGLWWGVPLLVAGLLSIPAALFVPRLGEVLIRVIDRNADQPLPRIQLLGPMLQELFTHARRMILIPASILIIGGLILVLFLYGLLRQGSKKAAISGEIAVDNIESLVQIEPDSSSLPQEPSVAGENQTPSGMFG